MKLHKPRIAGPSLPRGAGFHVSKKPEWLKKWVANQPKYVQLRCGCKVDLSIRGTFVRKDFGAKAIGEVLCETHDDWSPIVARLNLAEMFDIAIPPPQQDPLF